MAITISNTTSVKFLGDFNIPLDDYSDILTSQFPDLLSSNNSVLHTTLASQLLWSYSSPFHTKIATNENFNSQPPSPIFPAHSL